MKKGFTLPSQINRLEPPVTLEKQIYAQQISQEFNLPFTYFGGLFLESFRNHFERFAGEFGQILDGGNFLNEAYSSSLLANWGEKHNSVERFRNLAGEWVAFEKGVLLSGAFSEIGPIPYDNFHNCSFMVKPISDKLYKFFKRDAVLILRFHFPGIAPRNIDDLNIKIVANSPNIKNFSQILNAVGIEFKP